jgi:hypothetical protein
MLEIVDDPVCRPIIACFPRSESSNINDLLLISLPRACENIKGFYGLFRSYCAFYSGKRRDFSLLSRCSGFKKSRNSAGITGDYGDSLEDLRHAGMNISQIG